MDPTPPDEAAPPEPEPASSISKTPLRPAIEFGPHLLARVADFDCGPNPWDREVADYLRSPLGTGGALDDQINNKTKVWLYETEAGELVGYGSLGVSAWRWSDSKKGDWMPIHVIPFFGVQTPFQRQPPGPKSERYSRRIFEDLLTRALQEVDRHRFLGLCVNSENKVAIAFYKQFGFVEYTVHKGNLRMFVDLRGDG